MASVEKSKLTMICLTLITAVISMSVADNVPVLIWSPSRPLSDLPQAFVGNTIDNEAFQKSYLHPISSTKDNHVVVFLQDKLNLEDFAKYADIYNPYSDGSAFKNIKGLMDEHFSVHLPGVKAPQVALDGLKQDFKGRQHIVKSPSDISNLKLDDKSYLILVVLPSISGAADEEKAFIKSDGVVNEVVKQLKKREVKYTALFTGQSSQKKTERSSFKGRHLLESDRTNTSTFINVTGDGGMAMYFYARKIQLFQMDPVSKTSMFSLALPHDSYDKSNSTIGNNTGVFSLFYKDIKPNNSSDTYDFSMRFELSLDKSFRLLISNFTITLTNKSDTVEEAMDTQSAGLDFPAMFSYHCSAFNILNSNRTAKEPYYKLSIDGFQFQAFTNKDEFGHAWDCVTFFTTAIWMALFYGAIFIVILYYGMYMMFNLSTMDRFDDPKGKTITVNVNE